MRGQPLGLLTDPRDDRPGDPGPRLDPELQRLPAGRGPPGADDVDAHQHGPRAADHRPELLVAGAVRHDEIPVPSLQQQVVRPQQPHESRAAGTLSLPDEPVFLAVQAHRHGVLRPVLLHLRHGRVEERRHLVRGRGALEFQVPADRLQARGGRQRVRCRSPPAPRPTRNPLHHRRRRAGLQLESAVQRRDPERHLPRMHRIARDARPQVGIVEHLGEPGGHLALGPWFGDDLAQPGRHLRQPVEGRHTGLLERLAGADDPLDGVGLRQGGRRHEDVGQVGPAVVVRRGAQRPHQRDVLAPLQIARPGDRNAAVHQRPTRAVPARVLHAEVEDRRIGERPRRRFTVKLLRRDPMLHDLPPAERHLFILAQLSRGGPPEVTVPPGLRG